MHLRLPRRDEWPLVLAFATLFAISLLADGLLRAFDAVWVARYVGIAGLLIIIGSFGYSLRKRNLIRFGRQAQALRLHEAMAWTGSCLVLVHVGVHFNGVLGWLATAAMLLSVLSGLTGKYLVDHSRLRLEAAAARAQDRGLSAGQREESLYWDSLAFDVVKRWRVVHMPITLAFSVLTAAHVTAIFLFWAWK